MDHDSRVSAIGGVPRADRSRYHLSIATRDPDDSDVALRVCMVSAVSEKVHDAKSVRKTSQIMMDVLYFICA